jgi:flagellum-specific ATP synthase
VHSAESISSPLTITGTIVALRGNAITAQLPVGSIGDLCSVETRSGSRLPGQIISFDGDLFSLALFGEPEGLFPGATVRSKGHGLSVPIGSHLLGSVINPLGIPLDTTLRHSSGGRANIMAPPPPAAGRPPIERILTTGIRAIDGFCTIGMGQRIGIFASAGLGKSTLLGTMAKRAEADIIVVALVGERGREVQEFIDETLGESGLARSVLVVATSDDSSLMRQTAPYTATAIAEYFRDQGKNVLLIVDSLTRMARAIRETSIAAGEVPVRHGYTNSVYTQLPKLVERAGRTSSGSITGLYTVLTNQEDDIDPLADEIKSLLDGHICLRRELADLGVFPPIDITQSVSRLFSKLQSSEYRASAGVISRAMARYLKERQIALLGGVADDELSRILTHKEKLLNTMRQALGESLSRADVEGSIRAVAQLIANES